MTITDAFTQVLAPQAQRFKFTPTSLEALQAANGMAKPSMPTTAAVKKAVALLPPGIVHRIPIPIPRPAPTPAPAPAPAPATPVGDRPILQLSALPVTLTPGQFANAFSTGNPGGDLRSAFLFRQLVDAIPAFSHFYSPSGSSFESTYRTIVEGSSVPTTNVFASAVLADCEKKLQETTYANMDGTPGTWCPVDAVPADWWDMKVANRFQPLQLDLQNQGGPNSAFATIGGDAPLQVTVGGAAQKADSSTQVRSISMKYLLVEFKRSWYQNTLFPTAGWTLSGQDPGFCSSGKLDQNDGVFPLITTGMLLGTNVTVDATWGGKDKSMFDNAMKTNNKFSVGPFALNAGASSVQVIGWISSLIPLSPR